MVGKDAVDQLFDVIEPENPDADEAAIVLRVHVQPGPGRIAILGRHGDAVKVKVAAPPEGGRANQAVAELLASSFGLPMAHVILVSGATSPAKRYRLGPVDLDLVRRVIANAGSGIKETGPPPTGNVRGRGGVR
jgi:uncharacterized protein (TIGR00251 family)